MERRADYQADARPGESYGVAFWRRADVTSSHYERVRRLALRMAGAVEQAYGDKSVFMGEIAELRDLLAERGGLEKGGGR